jgi:hypothetical protein
MAQASGIMVPSLLIGGASSSVLNLCNHISYRLALPALRKRGRRGPQPDGPNPITCPALPYYVPYAGYGRLTRIPIFAAA